jgi:hypothetical protein
VTRAAQHLTPAISPIQPSAILHARLGINEGPSRQISKDPHSFRSSETCAGGVPLHLASNQFIEKVSEITKYKTSIKMAACFKRNSTSSSCSLLLRTHIRKRRHRIAPHTIITSRTSISLVALLRYGIFIVFTVPNSMLNILPFYIATGTPIPWEALITPAMYSIEIISCSASIVISPHAPASSSFPKYFLQV